MTISVDVDIPIAGTALELSSSAAGGQTTRWRLTSVPSESAMSTGFLLDAGGDYTSTFTPDVAGEYSVTAYGFASYSGLAAYDGDSVAAREVLTGSESGTVHVAAVVSLPIRTVEGEGADLLLTVQNETVVAAELANPTSERARVGTIQTAVATAVDAIVGVSTASVAMAVISAANELRNKYEAHRPGTVSGTKIHNGSGDTINLAVKPLAYSVTSAIELANDLADKIQAHVGPGSWHNTSAVGDSEHRLITAKSNTLAETFVMLADLRFRVFEPHRAKATSPAPNVHDNADATNVLTAAATLESAIVAYLNELASPSSSIVSGETEGAVDLMQAFGFVLVST